MYRGVDGHGLGGGSKFVSLVINKNKNNKGIYIQCTLKNKLSLLPGLHRLKKMKGSRRDSMRVCKGDLHRHSYEYLFFLVLLQINAFHFAVTLLMSSPTNSMHTASVHTDTINL